MKKTINNLFAAAIVLMAAATFAGAATLTVTNTDDDGTGNLRAAITSANAAADADTIVFASPLFNTAQTIDLTSGQLLITNPLTITGTGARLLTVRRSSTASRFRIFTINSTANTVRISGMTISNGDDSSSPGSPIGGVNNNGALLTLDGVTVSGNKGRGVNGSSVGTMTILNSTISNNTGVGVFVRGAATDIANTTISGNDGTNDFGFGGIYVFNSMANMNNVTVTNNTPNGVSNDRNTGTLNIRNSLISGNANNMDVNGAFVSNGNNLIGNTANSTGFTQPTDKTNVAANLAALANNGGQTDTHALNVGSPAIDAGNNCVVNQSCGTNNPPVALTTDQRGAGFARQNGTAVDIGAFESAAPTAASVTLSGRAVTSTGRGIRNVIIQMTDASGTTRTAMTSAFGYYRFNDVAAGATYILTARGKTYRFDQPTQVVSLSEDAAEINFVAYPFGRMK